MKNGLPDTNCLEPLVTIKTGNIFEKKKLATNSLINFKESHKIWGQNNKPFKSYSLVGIRLMSLKKKLK